MHEQQRERNTHNLKVAGSNPARATNSPPTFEGGLTSPGSPGFFLCGDTRAPVLCVQHAVMGWAISSLFQMWSLGGSWASEGGGRISAYASAKMARSDPSTKNSLQVWHQGQRHSGWCHISSLHIITIASGAAYAMMSNQARPTQT